MVSTRQDVQLQPGWIGIPVQHSLCTALTMQAMADRQALNRACLIMKLEVLYSRNTWLVSATHRLALAIPPINFCYIASSKWLPSRTVLTRLLFHSCPFEWPRCANTILYDVGDAVHRILCVRVMLVWPAQICALRLDVTKETHNFLDISLELGRKMWAEFRKPSVHKKFASGHAVLGNDMFAVNLVRFLPLSPKKKEKRPDQPFVHEVPLK